MVWLGLVLSRDCVLSTQALALALARSARILSSCSVFCVTCLGWLSRGSRDPNKRCAGSRLGCFSPALGMDLRGGTYGRVLSKRGVSVYCGKLIALEFRASFFPSPVVHTAGEENYYIDD